MFKKRPGLWLTGLVLFCGPQPQTRETNKPGEGKIGVVIERGCGHGDGAESGYRLPGNNAIVVATTTTPHVGERRSLSSHLKLCNGMLHDVIS
ncbi:hypothetical protein LX32DRAFT_642604 [Colletotrichum zoysiae]|uniref:Secreted protein n=1 Tax=Colletotrichum zoysiae TaxID=1216348 RepID=A0AAD9HCI6_9PEZI|nr:hypothetical protein LX32DRAFT_642604 [Colletotrichum zoysiae]